MSAGTISIREKFPVLCLGELHVRMTAKQGLSVCSELTSVLRTLNNTFSMFVRDNIERLNLRREDRSLNFPASVYLTEWSAALDKDSRVKSHTIAIENDQVVIDAVLNTPVVRNHGAPHADDCKIRFVLTWQDIGELRKAA